VWVPGVRQSWQLVVESLLVGGCGIQSGWGPHERAKTRHCREESAITG